MHACMHAFRGTYYTADLHPLMRFRLGTFSLQRHPFWHISGIQDFSHSNFYRNIIYTKVFPTDCIFFPTPSRNALVENWEKRCVTTHVTQTEQSLNRGRSDTMQKLKDTH